MELLIHWIVLYGYSALFLLLVGGVVGLPIPDEMLLLFVGYQVNSENMSLFFSLAVATLGATIGISVSYLLGKHLGLPFLLKIAPKIYVSEKRIEQAQTLFQKHGTILLLVGFFLPGIRHLTGFLAGVSSIPFWKFATFAYSGAIIWVTSFIFLGNLMGARWYLVYESIGHPWFLLLLLLSCLLLTTVFMYHKKYKY